MPSDVLPLHLKETFPPIIWTFTEGEGDGIESRLPFKIFSTLRKIASAGMCVSCNPKEGKQCPIIFSKPCMIDLHGFESYNLKEKFLWKSHGEENLTELRQ